LELTDSAERTSWSARLAAPGPESVRLKRAACTEICTASSCTC